MLYNINMKKKITHYEYEIKDNGNVVVFAKKGIKLSVVARCDHCVNLTRNHTNISYIVPTINH